ncbi:MAG: hypothetical protein ACLFQS_11675, partial [Bacteroidales bacterium]
YYEKYWDAIRVEKAALEDLKIINKNLTEKNSETLQRLEQEIWQREEAEKREIAAKIKEDKALKEKEQAKKREEQAQKREKEVQTKLIKAIKRMLTKGFTPSEIATDLEITEEDVRKFMQR